MEAATKEFEKHLTLTQFILATGRKHPEATGQLSILLHSIEIACKYISSKVRAAGLLALYGAEGSTNVQGEVVKKLDVVSNEAFITSLKRSRVCSLMVSEENEEPILVKDSMGHYAVAFDPLDGSSNIDANVSIGTIFAIYKMDHNGPARGVEDILKPGTELTAAGYCMYGSATLMVLTIGEGVHGFTLDPTSGEFVYSHPNITVPKKKNIYSVNEGYAKFWLDPVTQYVNKIKHPQNDKEVYSARYVGSMVADVHRTLLYGGIFMYPADQRSADGKLRLLYEANPMALLMERAGGKASTGSGRILEVVPKDIHQRIPVFLGSQENVSEAESYFNKN